MERAERRACPRCGGPLAPAQDWCLNCGAAATTRIVAPPAWRGPLVAMTGVLVVAIAALVLAFFALADDDGSTGPPPGVATPTAGAPTPGPSATPETSATPAPTSTPESGGEPAAWPQGHAAWTIVLSSSTSRAAARRRAQRLTDDGLTVGVLHSNDFSSLRPGFWVVFSGQYDSSREAAQAQQDLGAAAPPSAYVRRITPR